LTDVCREDSTKTRNAKRTKGNTGRMIEKQYGGRPTFERKHRVIKNVKMAVEKKKKTPRGTKGKRTAMKKEREPKDPRKPKGS